MEPEKTPLVITGVCSPIITISSGYKRQLPKKVRRRDRDDVLHIPERKAERKESNSEESSNEDVPIYMPKIVPNVVPNAMLGTPEHSSTEDDFPSADDADFSSEEIIEAAGEKLNMDNFWDIINLLGWPNDSDVPLRQQEMTKYKNLLLRLVKDKPSFIATYTEHYNSLKEVLDNDGIFGRYPNVDKNVIISHTIASGLDFYQGVLMKDNLEMLDILVGLKYCKNFHQIVH